MSLNSDFRNACIETGFNKSCFTGEQHSWNDLQVCHILSKSKTTLNAIKKAYNCSSKTAELIMNMPLLNTVIGSRQDNAEYKKTEDISYIDSRICCIVYSQIISKYGKNKFKIKPFNRLINILYDLYQNPLVCAIADDNKVLFTGIIKDIQLQFHREINLHT